MTTTTSIIEGKTPQRVRVFAGYAPAYAHVRVDLGDGTVRVYDDVAGHYTLRHSLTPRAQARIIGWAKRGGLD